MEGRREGVMEKLKELRVMREDLKAMRRRLEEIKTLVKEGIAKTREEREVKRRRGMERNKREKGGSKEEIPRKLEMESRRKERRKEVG